MICNCVPFVLNLSQVTSLAQYTALNSLITTNLNIIVWVGVLYILLPIYLIRFQHYCKPLKEIWFYFLLNTISTKSNQPPDKTGIAEW